MISENKSLKNFNTMKVDVNAKNFFIVKEVNQLDDIFKHYTFNNVLVIGGGSNIVFTKDFEGLVIKNEIMGIDILFEDNDFVIIKAGAGINWNEFVLFSIKNNWAGIENLSLIPGTVGAAPVQNIGAYGQEVQDVIISVDAYDFSTFQSITFSNFECQFSYRKSIFKQKQKNNFIITSVTFELKKHFKPNLSYPAIKNALSKKSITNPTLKQLSDTVIEIRQSKLPDYLTLSNCGSFFTNPYFDKTKFDSFINKYQDAPYFSFNNGYKLSAGWLIEQAGWRGKRIGNVGCYDKHALVIVNYGGATGKEIFNFSEMIRKSVYEKFGVTLEYEVNIL